MASREQIQFAAAELEELLMVGRQVVNDMRDDSLTPDKQNLAYARVYWLRRRFNQRVVHRLGEGVPPELSQINNHYIQDPPYER